jgi:hypothetical protein
VLLNRIRLAAPLLALACLTGCATGYHDMRNPLVGWTGGYWEDKGPGELIKVGFAGNGAITRDKVGTYLLYRCAEVAQRERKAYFALYQSLPEAVMDRRSSEKTVTTVTGKPTAYAYILFFDDAAPGLLSTADVLKRLAPEVTGGPSK